MKTNKIKELTFTGMMIALCIVLRYILSPFPNIKPIAAILILLTMFISTRVSIITGACTMLITGMIYGFGVWIPLQIFGFAIISLGTKLFTKQGIIVTVAWGVLSCYIYGFIVNFSMLCYVPISSLIPSWISGLYFDTLHAVSTIVFLILLYKPFKSISKKICYWLFDNKIKA